MDTNDFNASGLDDPDPDYSTISSDISTTSSEESEEESVEDLMVISMLAAVAAAAAVIVIVPTLFRLTPPPAPSTRKRRLSELEYDDSSSQSAIPSSSSAGSLPTSHSTILNSADGGSITATLSFLRHELSKLEDLLRLKNDRLAREQLVQRDPWLEAIYRMQQVDSDLPIDDQVTLVNLFMEGRINAEMYLSIESDPVRKEWIKLELAKAGSG
jgi:hypothetical protein